jgi:hypothetical protein
MSDEGFAPPGGPPASGDSASVEEGLSELRKRREAGTANLQPEPDRTEPPPTKLADGKADPLTASPCGDSAAGAGESGHLWLMT